MKSAIKGNDFQIEYFILLPFTRISFCERITIIVVHNSVAMTVVVRLVL